ncbi:MAG: hypothetical protein ACFFAY_15520 [Promethearchaeota archaeon]
MSKDLPTELQALYGSGGIAGFLCSFLPKEGLKKGWVEQGLAYKGMKSSISTKTNQAKYVLPTEQLIRLMCDRGMDAPRAFGLAISGVRGLTKEKFCVILSDASDAMSKKRAISLWTKTQTPHEIVQLAIRYELGTPPLVGLGEPNIDYVEQLKEDSSDGKIHEALVLRIPKVSMDETEWIKESLGATESDTDFLLYRFGKLKETPAFALLFSKSLSDLRLAKPAEAVIFASILMKSNWIEMVLLDSPRGIATFALVKKDTIGELAWKYLLPLWAAPDERIDPLVIQDVQESSETERGIPDAKDSSTDNALHALEKKIRSLEQHLNDISVSQLLKRLEQIERRSESLRVAVSRLSELERAIEQANAQDIQDQASIGLLQSRLEDLLKRMEVLASKLENLDERIIKLGTDLSE